MIYIAPQYLPWFQQQAVHTYEQLLTLCQGELINNSGNNTTWRNLWKQGENDFRVYIKRYQYSLSPRYMYPRVPRALVEMQNYNFWQEQGVPGPEVIAAGAHSPLGFHHTSMVITREIKAAEDLSVLCQQNDFRENESMLKTVFDQLADILVKAHQAHFYHYDLHFRNIMVQYPSSTSQRPKVHWIDAPRGKCKPLPFPRRYLQIKDLACVYRDCHKQQWLALWQHLSSRYYEKMGYETKTIDQIKNGIRRRLGRRIAISQQGDGIEF